MLGQAPLGGMNDILRPTALQRWGHRREAMPLRWSLADPVASVAINMAHLTELFDSSRLLCRRVKDTYKVQRTAALQNLAAIRTVQMQEALCLQALHAATVGKGQTSPAMAAGRPGGAAR